MIMGVIVVELVVVTGVVESVVILLIGLVIVIGWLVKVAVKVGHTELGSRVVKNEETVLEDNKVKFDQLELVVASVSDKKSSSFSRKSDE